MTSSFTTNEHVLGSSIITYAVYGFMALMTIAATWSCSTLLGGMCMFIAMSLLSYVLTQLAFLAINMFVADETVAGLGRVVGSSAARFTSLFTRKVTA